MTPSCSPVWGNKAVSESTKTSTVYQDFCYTKTMGEDGHQDGSGFWLIESFISGETEQLL